MDKIGIIGCGVMGSQLAIAFQSRKLDVIIKVKSKHNVNNYKEVLYSYCEDVLWRRYLGHKFILDELEKIKFTTNIEELKDRELVIETTSENYQTKFKVIEELNSLHNSKLIVATNTSGLLISKLAHMYKFPNQFVGLHFFNPLSTIKLVEMTMLPFNEKSLHNKLIEFTNKINKRSLVIEEKSGLFVNRLIAPFWIDTIKELESSQLTPFQIDNALKLGCNYPIGPLELLDIIGLDVFLDYCTNVFTETNNNKFLAPDLLKTKVAKGQFGRKSNQGFYEWTGNQIKQ